MKRTFLWLGFGVLAAGMAFAQDATSSASGSQDQNTQTQRQSTSRSVNELRGCLSGSTGNYTVTDSNGKQYEVNGDDNTLRSMVGREVQITLSENRSTNDSTQPTGTTTHSSNTVQASDVKVLATSCSTPGGTTTPLGNSATPQPTSDDRPAPRMMSMLMQQSMPGQSQNGTSSQPQATPPVTSQTPAAPTSPTAGSSSQPGTSPANNNGMTEGQANPTTGQAAGSSASNQSGATNGAPSSPSNAQTPQANSNDANKPLYERQATDIPYAKSSNGNGTSAPPQ